MSLKLLLSLLPTALFLLTGLPSLAQMQDGMGEPSLEDTVPGDSMPVEPAPVTPEPSVESEFTPESPAIDQPTDTAPIGGAEARGPSGPNSLVQCGPSGAAFIVTEVPVGCRVLSVNSPPGQVTNAESP